MKEVKVKGIARCLVGEGVDEGALRFHVTEVGAGTRSHEPHSHTGTEMFYILEGRAEVEADGESHSLGAGESIVLDAVRPHGIRNGGDGRLRYIVVIAP